MFQIGKISFVNGKVRISYVVAIEKESEDGIFYCNIPSFNISFYTTDRSEVDRKSKAFIQSFVDYYLKRESFNTFILAINALGFRSEKHMLKMSQMLNRKSNSGTFKMSAERKLSENIQQSSMELVY
jgi:hypothetical protein